MNVINTSCNLVYFFRVFVVQLVSESELAEIEESGSEIKRRRMILMISHLYVNSKLYGRKIVLIT
jgi:hypothetical protein